MMDCLRCATSTPRLTPTQRYCPQCEREVAERERQDARRLRGQFVAKDLTGVR